MEAPIAVFTSTPDPVSNTDSWDFTFECTNEIYCTFLCSVQLVGDQSNFVDCYGSFAVSGLVDGGSYVIYVTPIDAVGNIGNTIDYQWSIGINYVHIYINDPKTWLPYTIYCHYTLFL